VTIEYLPVFLGPAETISDKMSPMSPWPDVADIARLRLHLHGCLVDVGSGNAPHGYEGAGG